MNNHEQEGGLELNIGDDDVEAALFTGIRGDEAQNDDEDQQTEFETSE